MTNGLNYNDCRIQVTWMEALSKTYWVIEVPARWGIFGRQF